MDYRHKKKVVTMKRLLLLCLFASLATTCSVAQEPCAEHAYEQQELARDPGLYAAQQSIQAFVQRALAQQEIISGAAGAVADINNLPLIRIPVVVHILYNSADQDISNAQVRSQIDVLNQDFRRLNSDTSQTPAVFRSLAADCFIQFELATADPQGYATTGIVRKKTNVNYFGADDGIKFANTGGDDAWNSDQYLNIWVGNLTGGLMGYSSLLGGAREKDGIVVRYTAFGTTGKLEAPYLKGRTATHEVGHWLGLKHIWGDMYCGNDGIDDTPPQSYSTRGCPDGQVVISCDNGPNGNMYMDYMDLTNDACMNMFTIGQRAHMRSLFDEGGPRHALLSSDALTDTPRPVPAGALPIEDSLVQSSLRLYPNPATTTVLADLSGDAFLVGQTLTIYNQLGQAVRQVRLVQTKMQLDISDLKTGLYFLRVGNGRETVKLLRVGAAE